MQAGKAHPHAHCQILMPVMISPRSAQDSLRVPCLQLSGPHKNAPLVNTGGMPWIRGLLISRPRPSAAAQAKLRAPNSSAPGKRTRAANWLGPPRSSRLAPVLGKGSFRWGHAVAGPLTLAHALVLLSSALGVPPHRPWGVPSCLVCEVRSTRIFQPPTILPTSPPSVPSMPCKEHGRLVKGIAQLVLPHAQSQ